MRYWLSKGFLSLVGWQAEPLPPLPDKFVIIAAPHTSNWDFFLLLAISFKLRLHVHWLGKHTIFFFPLGLLLRRLGGIPVNRSDTHGVVNQTLERFREYQTLRLAISPEGTRRRVEYWKSGFYLIAVGAQVPIACAFVDYKRRVGGIGKVFMPTGVIATDMQTLRDFYEPIPAKYPEKFGPIRLREDTVIRRPDRAS